MKVRQALRGVMTCGQKVILYLPTLRAASDPSRLKQSCYQSFQYLHGRLFEALIKESDYYVKAIQHDEVKGAISEVIDRYRAGNKHLWKP